MCYQISESILLFYGESYYYATNYILKNHETEAQKYY